MIRDGYTFRHRQFYFRPLAEFGREIAKEHFRSKDWDSLGAFLWTRPQFYGNEDEIEEDDQQTIFRAMMEYDTDGNFQNLKDSVRIILTDPRLSMRTCASCKKWWFDHDTGLVARNSEGLLLRPEDTALPCETREGCSKGHYDSPIELNETNQKVWKHYLEWRSVGLPNEDKYCPIVRRNWSIISRLIEKHGFPAICN
jgi:hypothetical protein